MGGNELECSTSDIHFLLLDVMLLWTPDISSIPCAQLQQIGNELATLVLSAQ